MSQKVAVAVVYVAAMFMTIMDTTIVNVALPTLGREFHTRPEAVDAVVIGFLVSLAVFIPASGWVGDRFGGRRTLLTAIVLFTAASALCGTATSLGELVVFRVLQGVGGGLMTPVGLAMLFRVFPPAERVRASSILVVPTALAPALGPVLGGIFVTELSWRWVFYVNVPIGICALIFGAVFLEDHLEEQGPGRFDVAGFAASGVGLGLLMYGLSDGPIRGWGEPAVVTTTAAGVALLVAMVAIELHTRSPMVDLRLFSNRLFRASNLVMLLAAMAFIGVLYMVALFYQDGLHLSALQSGLNTFPEALGVMCGSQLVTRGLYPVLGPRRVIMAGTVVIAGAMAAMTSIGFHTDLWWARGLLFVIGFGMSGVFIPTQAASMATISPAATGRASTLFNVQRQLGGAIGVAVLTSVLAAVGPVHLVAGHPTSNLGAYYGGFLTAAGLALAAGMCAAVAVRDEDAASTMTGRRGPRRPKQLEVAGGAERQATPLAG